MCRAFTRTSTWTKKSWRPWLTRMRVVGIDCGTERTGFGVIDSDGRTHTFITAGVLRPKPSFSLEFRLKQIAAGLRDVLRDFSPQAVAVEEVFHAVNAKSALKLAHVR